VLLLALLTVAGCRSYSRRTSEAFGHFERGDFGPAVEAFSNSKTTGSEFLSGAEAGMAALAGGDWERALHELGRAAEAVKDVEERALIGPERLGESILSWTLNESFQAYRGEGYERVMVHAGLALAYLGQGKLEDVYVEARLSNRLLETEEKLYEKSYQAGGFGHFLSAITYELLGEPDQAYIDYQRMEAKGVGTELAGKALVRLAGELRYDDDFERWQDRYGEANPPEKDFASIVVLAGVGIGPWKQEIWLPIPTSSGVLTWAVPQFVERPQPVTSLMLHVPNLNESIATVAVEDVTKVAMENLDDRIAWLAAKSAVRSIMKRELTQQLEDQHGTFGRILGDVFSLVTEHADLRCWQTLPSAWHAARVFLPPGLHELSLEAVGGENLGLGSFELGQGETMFVIARTIGPRVHAHVLGGGTPPEPALEEVPSAPETGADPAEPFPIQPDT
jgi:hypothetical protein